MVRLIVLFTALYCTVAFNARHPANIWKHRYTSHVPVRSQHMQQQFFPHPTMRSSSISSTPKPTPSNSLAMKAAVSMPSVDIDTSGALNVFNAIPRAVSKIAMGFKAFFVMIASVLLRAKRKLSKNIELAANAMEGGWTKRGEGGSVSRTIEIWGFALSWAFKFFANKKYQKKNPEKFTQGQVELAASLRDKLLQLGPTFIKLGQLLSTRIDVVPREYISALVSLQDQVPGFSGDIAVQIIERELGKPIDQLYDNFNRTSFAAASLGQVHRATLNGQEVIVKVQRQGLKKLFDMDLKNIKVLAQLLNAFDPKSDGAQRDWVSIYEESAKLLYKEIDYENEAQNAIRFKNNFKDVPWVKVPEVYTNMTTTNIITQEFVPGIKVNDLERIDAAGIDRELLSKRSAESYLMQLCRHGFFHCDPHPGNVACDTELGGRLIYYDFGMMDELKPRVKSGLVNLIFGIYENEPKECCDALEDIEVLRKGVDRISVERIARSFLSEFQSGIKPGEKWVSELDKEEQAKIRNQRRLQLGSDLFSVGSDVPFRFPPTFTFVFRAFTSLDGIGKGLDKNYDLVRLTQPFLKELIDLRDGSAYVTFANSIAKKLGWRPIDIKNAVMQPRKVANVDEIVTKMEEGDLKIRVRVLESERAFKRMELVQSNMATAIAASAFLNVGLVLATAAAPTGKITAASKVALALAGVFGVQVPIGLSKLKALDKKFAGLV